MTPRSSRQRFPGSSPGPLLVVLVLLLFWLTQAVSAASTPCMTGITVGGFAFETPLREESFLEAVCRHQALWGTLAGGIQFWCWPFKLAELTDLTVQSGATRMPLARCAGTVLTTPAEQRIRLAGETGQREIRLAAAENPCEIVIELLGPWGPDEGVAMTLVPVLLPMHVGGKDQRVIDFSREEQKLWVRSSEYPVRLEVEVDGSGAVLRTDSGRVEVLFSGPHTGRLVLRGAIDRPYARRAGLPPCSTDVVASTPRIKLGQRDLTPLLVWSAVSLDRLWIANPDLGPGLISGYGPADDNPFRPRYAWFFDEPMLACASYVRLGQYRPVRDAFRMLRKYQRADGKPVHEITQSLRYWPRFFQEFRYAYMHADSGPFYLVGHWMFWRATGDGEFLAEQWESIRKAYAWCTRQLDERTQLFVIGEGDWGGTEATVEIETDAFTNGMWLVALRAVAEMAGATGDDALRADAIARYRKARPLVEKAFWDVDEERLVWGYRRGGTRVAYSLPHLAIPSWLGAFSDTSVERTLTVWAGPKYSTNYGVRSWPADAPDYAPGAYQRGSVWPVWTAGVHLCAFRHGLGDRFFEQWMDLTRAMFLPETNGHMPEVLRGDRFALAPGAVQHQMFSHLAPVNVLIDGILGIEPHVPRRQLYLSPALPAEITEAHAEGVHFGPGERFAVSYRKTAHEWEVVLDLQGLQECVSIELELPVPFQSLASARVDGASVAVRSNRGRSVVRKSLAPGRHRIAARLELER